jgi:hypothetical protein
LAADDPKLQIIIRRSRIVITIVAKVLRFIRNFRADQSRRSLDEGKTETVVVEILQNDQVTLVIAGDVVNDVAP